MSSLIKIYKIATFLAPQNNKLNITFSHQSVTLKILKKMSSKSSYIYLTLNIVKMFYLVSVTITEQRK